MSRKGSSFGFNARRSYTYIKKWVPKKLIHNPMKGRIWAPKKKFEFEKREGDCERQTLGDKD